MCLISKDKKPKVADKDIVCYKVITVCDSNNWSGLFYKDDKFPFNKEVHALGKQDIYTSSITGNTLIEGGFFHTSTLMYWSENLLNAEENFINDAKIKIVKCIIPKGNEYYTSHDGLEVCSPSMIVYDSLYTNNRFKTFINYIKNLFK